MHANAKIDQVVDVAHLVASGAVAGATDAGVAFLAWDAHQPRLVASAGWTSAIAKASSRCLKQMVDAGVSFLIDNTMCAVIKYDDSGAAVAAVVADGPNVPATQHVYSELLAVLAAAYTTAAHGVPGCSTGYQRWIVSPNPRRDLLSALERLDWNVSALAEEWGVSRPTLYRAFRDHSIDLDRAPVAARRLARRRAGRS